MGKINIGKLIVYWANCYGFGTGVCITIISIVDKEQSNLLYLGLVLLVATGLSIAQYWKETYPK